MWKATDAGADARHDDVRQMAAVFNLNHPAHVISWHFFSMSVANVIAIVIMLVVFVLALIVRFPGADEDQRSPQ